jgi:radical SAM superfamily enzyme YgiQ (UPF0313 family)
MTRFLLINSPIFFNSTNIKEEYLPPLGLGYIATYLEEANIDVSLMDCVSERKSVKSIIKYINNNKYDYIGINVFTQNYEIVKYILENINKKCICFIGGQVVKYIYKEIIDWNSTAKIISIIGEGELIIPAVVTNTCKQKPFYKGIKNDVYLVNEESIYFPNNISCLKLSRKFFNNDLYINHYGEPEASIITSRGCIYNCAFCGGAKCLNKDIPIRIRNNNSIISEIKQLLELYPNLQSIRILDDLFLKSPKSIKEAYEIFKCFPNLSWRGMVHVLSLLSSLDKLDMLSKSNCKELFLGIESGSNAVRKRINKLGTNEQIIKVSKAILNQGIDLKGYFIYGFPHETKKDFLDTYHLASLIKDISDSTLGNFRASVFQFRPYHGTQLYTEIIEENGTIETVYQNDKIKSFSGRHQFNFTSGNFSAESDELLSHYINITQELTEE